MAIGTQLSTKATITSSGLSSTDKIIVLVAGVVKLMTAAEFALYLAL